MSGESRLRHVAAMNPAGRGSISTEEAGEVLAELERLRTEAGNDAQRSVQVSARIERSGPGPRERVTPGQWPPSVGDLVVRTLADGEQRPAGWTERPADPDAGSVRCAWRIWQAGDSGLSGDPDVAVAYRGP